MHRRSHQDMPRYRSQSGAFDLPSVLIGVAVVAILAIGVMATVFGIIPWAQDRAAQQDLTAVSTAQGTTYARDGSFTGKAALVGAGWLAEGTPATLETKAGADGKCYVAVTTSRTGNRFVASSEKPTPRPLTATDTWCSGVLISPDPSPVMVTTWDTSLAVNCKEITLPIAGFEGTVTWGDGTMDRKLTHPFAKAGHIEIRIDGTFTAWGGEGWGDSNCLVSVDRWGSTGTANLSYAFWNADNLTHVEAIPSGKEIDLRYAFNNVDSNFTLGHLDTSRVTTMSNMFRDAKKFNRQVEFDTAQVTNMSGMFYDATAFNMPVEFDTSNVIYMDGMFRAARSFNQRVVFDTSKVIIMNSMFSEAQAFNQRVDLNTSNVKDLSLMFYGAIVFNQPLSFETARVTSMSAMFNGASAYNHPVNFDTANVANMSYMFYNAKSFNQHVAFETVSAKSMAYMFYGASVFNQPLKFDTSNVTTMANMFTYASAFNQPLSFETSRVTDMTRMFLSATVFNQDLSSWNVGQVTGRAEFNSGSTWTLPKPKWVN